MATENIAVLFTDVEGSTALSQRVSAEAADEVRREHFSILRQAVTEWGGTEVKNLGDGLMVVFGSVSAADIVHKVEAQTGAVIDRRDVVLDEPIKALGEYSVRVELVGGVVFELTVNVVAEG